MWKPDIWMCLLFFSEVAEIRDIFVHCAKEYISRNCSEHFTEYKPLGRRKGVLSLPSQSSVQTFQSHQTGLPDSRNIIFVVVKSPWTNPALCIIARPLPNTESKLASVVLINKNSTKLHLRSTWCFFVPIYVLLYSFPLYTFHINGGMFHIHVINTWGVDPDSPAARICANFLTNYCSMLWVLNTK